VEVLAGEGGARVAKGRGVLVVGIGQRSRDGEVGRAISHAGGGLACPIAFRSLAATLGSVIAAMMRRGPPQRGQVSTSIRKTRRRSWAQGSLRARRPGDGDSGPAGFGTELGGAVEPTRSPTILSRHG